jgi:hypothetical protein
MMIRSNAWVAPDGRPRWVAMVAAFVAILFAANVTAQAPAAPGGAAPQSSAAELEKLVGRIALYPDDLVAVILPASTNPLQIVQADRFLDKRKSDPKLKLDDKWDDAVKTLLNYPEVVKIMSGDLDWTAALGEAVVEDQGEVLAAIQAYRRKVQAAGNLKSDPKQTVVVEKEVIKIVPADPQVIYVPQYNPTQVVVAGYPPAYYPAPYPSYYYPYPPGAAMATGLIWGAAIGAAWSGNHYGYGGGNTININTGNINTGNINRGNTTTQWKSNKQAGQVSSSVGKTAQTRGAGYGSASASGGAGRASMQSSAAARPSSMSSGASRPSAGASSSAFGGSGASGHQAQMNSSRGASSRSSMSSGARSGGGGRGRR